MGPVSTGRSLGMELVQSHVPFLGEGVAFGGPDAGQVIELGVVGVEAIEFPGLAVVRNELPPSCGVDDGMVIEEREEDRGISLGGRVGRRIECPPKIKGEQ